MFEIQDKNVYALEFKLKSKRLMCILYKIYDSIIITSSGEKSNCVKNWLGYTDCKFAKIFLVKTNNKQSTITKKK